MERIDSADGLRFYKLMVDGEEVLYPSVSTVVRVLNKDGLTNWAVREACGFLRTNMPRNKAVDSETLDCLLLSATRQHQHRLEEAADFGTRAHGIVEEFLSENRLPNLAALEPRMRAWVETFLGFWTENGLTCLGSEIGVWSTEYFYAGTCDILAVTREGALVVIDLKSSRSLHPEHFLQVVAYKQALAEMWDHYIPGFPLDDFRNADCMLVRIGRRDARLDVKRIGHEMHPRIMGGFLAARALFDYMMDWQKLAEITHVRSTRAQVEYHRAVR